MRRLYSLMAVVVLEMVGVVSVGGQQMQPYTSTEGRFSVQFPAGQVAQESEPITLQGGGSSTLYEFSLSSADGNFAYMVMYNDYPASYANEGPDATLVRTRDGAVKGKTLLSDMAINLNGVPGREFTCKDDNWNFTVRQLLQGKRLYQLIIVSKPDHPATLTSDFLNSFKIF
ncbi:MAG: hypothetical protein P4K93_12240 [Terracidiphilus sp.]|nr:hypothetical protein [Terracidiphilus sp.]MDR3798921.1 hypothetical protein [Terracidiphilus sp.]